MAFVSEYISQLTKDQMRELLVQYQNNMQQKGNPGYYLGKINEDGTKATLVDGTTVDIITRGLPGSYAPVYMIGGGKGLVDQEEPYTESIDQDVFRATMLFQSNIGDEGESPEQLRAASFEIRVFNKRTALTIGYSSLVDIIESIIAIPEIPGRELSFNYTISGRLVESNQLVVAVTKRIWTVLTSVAPLVVLESAGEVGCQFNSPCPPNSPTEIIYPPTYISFDSYTQETWVAYKIFNLNVENSIVESTTSFAPYLLCSLSDFPVGEPDLPSCGASFFYYMGDWQSHSSQYGPGISNIVLLDRTTPVFLTSIIHSYTRFPACGQLDPYSVSVTITECDCFTNTIGQAVQYFDTGSGSTNRGLYAASISSSNQIYSNNPLGDVNVIPGRLIVSSYALPEFSNYRYITLLFSEFSLPSTYFYLAYEGTNLIASSPLYFRSTSQDPLEGWRVITQDYVITADNEYLDSKGIVRMLSGKSNQYYGLAYPEESTSVVPTNERWIYVFGASGEELVVSPGEGRKYKENIETLGVESTLSADYSKLVNLIRGS